VTYMFRVENETDEVFEVYSVDTKDPDGCTLDILNMNGRGGIRGLEVGGYVMSWEDIDALQAALNSAERRWRR